MAELILVTGGSRSGKSSFALDLAEKKSERRIFVATCPVVDGELTERVRLHKEERLGRGWTTCEEELDLARAIATSNGEDGVVLIDCLTLWINNLMFFHEQDGKAFSTEQLRKQCQFFLAEVELLSGTVICVTNEVGLGIVPDNALARRYRDLVGICNQLIAENASEVYLVTCGISQQIK
ncbi:bifunctional adenosylcobinamide kinase/adenosylcobinamide-phosphate guanylyltransferase [Desulfotalea psychrophila]|uniref:Adenosylcobinamide kinase n=1 Tax=Desulfotalea psychrophila (strain LSv54 / DSM 12343) TaxID=177439 RepID=Q6ALU3_DESPS|nr:bifunctional adenosylcobinamide kinase/adenosylcobinamide-phosphate guanylyltransferase [Desulfotalea psychrophila]CAG36682.1 related to bifunctional cobalamin biosynthesis protein (CobP) [Desulfotalea psychrophila LSv54]